MVNLGLHEHAAVWFLAAGASIDCSMQVFFPVLASMSSQAALPGWCCPGYRDIVSSALQHPRPSAGCSAAEAPNTHALSAMLSRHGRDLPAHY